MGFCKDVYIEACEELEGVLYFGDSDQVARIEAFLKGQVPNARGIIHLSTEALILDHLDLFLSSWESMKSRVETETEDWLPVLSA